MAEHTSQLSSGIAPIVLGVPRVTLDAISSMDAPGDHFEYAPGRLRVPSANLSGPTFPGMQYVDVAAIFADGGYNSPKPIGNPLAKAALRANIFGIFFLPIVILVVLVIIALIQAQDLPGRVSARRAITVLAFDGVLIGDAAIFYLTGFSGLF